jgi:hypothetical protein
LPEDSLPLAMHDCTYEIYLATYKVARMAVRAHDASRLGSIRARAEARSGGARAAALLAVDDAEKNASKRTKLEVCRPVCDTKCERAV